MLVGRKCRPNFATKLPPDMEAIHDTPDRSIFIRERALGYRSMKTENSASRESSDLHSVHGQVDKHSVEFPDDSDQIGWSTNVGTITKLR